MSGPWEDYKDSGVSEDGPWSDYQPKEKAPEKKSTQAQAALEGFGQGAALGYLPQLQAATEPATNAILEKIASTNLGAELLGVPKGVDVNNGSYVERRDENIKRQQQLENANPLTYGGASLAGGLATGIATSGLLPKVAPASSVLGKIKAGMSAGAKGGAIYGAIVNPGDVEGEVSPLQLKDRAINTVKGAALGGVAGGIVPAAAESVKGAAGAVKKVSNKIGEKLEKLAEKAAVNSTGATGKQASQFEDDAGRQLLDRKIVKFGDSQEQIARRAGDAVDKAGKQIDDALSKLEKDGVKVDANKIYSKVKDKITELGSDPSQADIAKILDNELDNLVNAVDKKGSVEFGVKEAEKIKRGYNRKAGNWADPEKGAAGKEMYQAYREGVENAAQKADPTTAKLFEEGKKSYGLLAPIKEAAERRAATTAQSPAGGFLDTVAAYGGAAASGGTGAVAAPIARRIISPRISSSVAVGADQTAKLLKRFPDLAALEAKTPGAVYSLIQEINKGSASVSNVAEEKPLKGKDKWANEGFEKVKKSVDPVKLEKLERMKKQFMASQKGRDILSQISTLPPGSKAFENAVKQLEKIEVEQ